MVNRVDIEKLERDILKPYACFSDDVERLHSAGKSLTKHPLRTDFQRDRDRILHSKSFRRLENKTQVYLTNKGDHLRTRLTHSLEVSQIARTIAIQLGLNTDLVEAIALGHDVGHTPFGHAAERELNSLLQEDKIGGFKHNIQSVKIFYNLEKKYDYDGLALTIPVLEGILKHTKINVNTPEYFDRLYLEHTHSVTLEGQVVAIADEIAQITHDMDDYLRYHILTINDFLEHEIFNDVRSFYTDNYSLDFDELIEIDDDRKKEVLIRCLIDYLVTTLLMESQNNLNDELRAFKICEEIITFGTKDTLIKDFHSYISNKCIKDFRVEEMDRRGKDIVRTLYNIYKNYPEKLPISTQKLYKERGILTIADYISGMTDRYALKKYNEIIEL